MTKKNEQKPVKDKNVRDDYNVETECHIGQEEADSNVVMPERKQDSFRNGLVYARQLNELAICSVNLNL